MTPNYELRGQKLDAWLDHLDQTDLALQRPSTTKIIDRIDEHEDWATIHGKTSMQNCTDSDILHESESDEETLTARNLAVMNISKTKSVRSPRTSLFITNFPAITPSTNRMPSKPINQPSNSTPQVSSPRVAVLNLTTVSSLLVMVLKTELTTSLSRTPGVPLGEIRDISKSDKTTSVVSF
jgi:hypothetical protein